MVVLGVMIGAHLYHGFRFGRHDPLTMTANSLFLAVVIVIILATMALLAPVDWSQSFAVSLPGQIEQLELPNSPLDIPNLLDR